MKKAIIINNLFLLIDFLPNESEEMFYDRVNFIIKKYEMNKDKIDKINNKDKINKIDNNLDKIISLSKIYSNIKYKKCNYSHEIMEEILST
jgi:hypothetical protein